MKVVKSYQSMLNGGVNMDMMPVSAKTYFNDFSMHLVTYSIKRNFEIISSAQGIPNKDEDGTHVGFLLPADIKPNDVLISDYQSFVISKIQYAHYNGQPEMIKAYY